jgi:hypothetical protein
MTKPLSGLKPVLEVLAQGVDILPAIGQAVEDLLRPDQEEVEDSILSREDKRIEIISDLQHPPVARQFRERAAARHQRHAPRHARQQW